jgi:8-oxo-dGTP pyrophosphatase MutT (NUDIX family)
MKISAGFVIIYDNKILLLHPTNSPWHGTYSIPKGLINNNENLLESAIRETQEEIGVEFKREDINDLNPECISYHSKSGYVFKKVWYYVICLKEPLDVNTFKLQSEEVDWAGFLDKKEAEKRILGRLKDVLKHLK